jgi:hypothetical protein
MTACELTIEPDGHGQCSCKQWGDGILGPIGRNPDITEDWVRHRFASHKNAYVIQLSQVQLEDLRRTLSDNLPDSVSVGYGFRRQT